MKTIIMTIKRRHFRNMVKGVKHYEMRTTRPSAELPVTVLLCVSGTGGEIRGSFICREIEDATMWGPARIAKAACITTDEAEGYRRNAQGKRRRLYAWKVDDMRAGGDVLSIYDYGATRPPQSWQYVRVPCGDLVID